MKRLDLIKHICWDRREMIQAIEPREEDIREEFEEFAFARNQLKQDDILFAQLDAVFEGGQ